MVLSKYYINIRVLHIEDDDLQQRHVKRLLSGCSYAEIVLTPVECLQQGLNLLRTNSFDCVLLDLKLPDSEGLETFHQVHGSTELPIVVLTGETDLYLRLEVVSAGAQDCISKLEATSEVLLRSLRFAVERHRTVLELRYALREMHYAHDTMRALLREIYLYRTLAGF